VTRVFSHGGLRLVLLSLLEDGPKHGYELIVALEERFMGMYRPSSGTIYPRLAALEEEGLITGVDADGKRSYALTDAGRDELGRRRAELDDTVISATSTIRTAMDGLQAEIRAAVANVQAEVSQAVAEARRGASEAVTAPDSPARQAWRASEHSRRLAVDEAKRVRRAADELRRQAAYEARSPGDAVRAAADSAAEAATAVANSAAAAADAARSELETLLADMAGWTSEAGELLRRHLPDDRQRARLRAALDEARRAFLDTLGTDTGG